MRQGLRDLARYRATWVFPESQLHRPVPSTARRNQQSPRFLASARGPGVGPGRLRRAHKILAGALRTRGAATVHRPICSGTVRSVSREVGAAELGCQRASRCCAPSGSWKRPRRCARGCRTRGLNLPRAGRGAGPGAGRGCEARAGRGEGGLTRTFPPLYLSPTSPPPLDPQDWRRGCRLLEDNGHPLSPPSPTSPRLWLLSEAKPAGAPSGTKKSGGVLTVKRGPRSVAVRTVRENNGTPPAPGTLVLTLVSPPLPVLPNPPSSAGLRSGGRGPAGKKGHPTRSPQRGRSSLGTPG